MFDLEFSFIRRPFSLSRLSFAHLCLVILICSFLLVPKVYGQADFFVKEEVQVFSKPDRNSEVLITLQEGDKALASTKYYHQGWRKIRVRVGEKPRVGYVDGKDLRLSFFKERGGKPKIAPHRERWSFGGGVGLGYLLQTERSYSLSGGAGNLDVNKMATPALSLSGYIELPFDGHKIKLYGIARYFMYSGQGVTSSGDTRASVQQTELALGAGGNAKIYLGSKNKYWIGAGGELSKALSAQLTTSDDTQLTEEEPPLYLFATLNFGWDHEIIPGLYILPEVRGLFSFKPNVYGMEFFVSSGFGF